MEFWNCVISTFIEYSGAVRNTFATLKNFFDLWVCFKTLKFFVWVQVGILIVEAHDKSKMNEIGFHVIQETARIHIRRKRPSNRVLNMTLLKVWVALVNLPDLFQADSIVLNTDGILIQ